jgi:hypothetical protein
VSKLKPDYELYKPGAFIFAYNQFSGDGQYNFEASNWGDLKASDLINESKDHLTLAPLA